MGKETAIQWTDATVNWAYGCDKVSAECKHCYAIDVVEAMPRKFQSKSPEAHGFYSGLAQNGNWTGVVKINEDHMLQPLRWKQPKKIFVNSLGDTFHEDVKDSDILRFFAIMAASPWHTFQILTKRAKRLRDLLQSWEEEHWTGLKFAFDELIKEEKLKHAVRPSRWPLSNVWIGVTAGTQETANERIPLLLQTPAATRFVSCEPLLTAIDLRSSVRVAQEPDSIFLEDDWYDHPRYLCPNGHLSQTVLKSEEKGAVCLSCQGKLEAVWGLPDWIIVGGESGASPRPMDMKWALDLRDQCKQMEIAYFFKQQSDTRAGQRPYLIESNDSHTAIQQFPKQEVVR